MSVWLFDHPWCVAFEDDVCGFDELSHEGNEDKLFGFAVGLEPLGECLEVGIAAFCGECGDVEHASGSAAATGDEAGARMGARVSVMRSHADQACRLAVLHVAQFGHADEHAGGNDGSEAGQAHQ